MTSLACCIAYERAPCGTIAFDFATALVLLRSPHPTWIPGTGGMLAPWRFKAACDTHVKEMVATIGENMNVRRTAAVSVTDGVVADYVHAKVADGLGKIGVLVALESAGDKPALFEFGRMIAMHVAAANPIALELAAVPADVLAREKAILEEKNQGKKPEMFE